VRIGPNTLSINTIAGLQAIYASRSANVQKSDWYRTIDASTGGFSTHSEIDTRRHAFRRRVLEHAFSDGALRSAETLVHRNVDLWCEYLGKGATESGTREGWTPPRNMNDWCVYLGYDVMGDWTFGQRFNCIESEEHRYVPHMMMESTKLVYLVSRTNDFNVSLS
jgi:cytochrome P450